MFKNVLTADLASLFLVQICLKHCKSHDKSLKSGQPRKDIHIHKKRSLFYLGRLKFFNISILLLTEKVLLFLYSSAERLGHPSY